MARQGEQGCIQWNLLLRNKSALWEADQHILSWNPLDLVWGVPIFNAWIPAMDGALPSLNLVGS